MAYKYPREVASNLLILGRKVKESVKLYEFDLISPYFHDVVNCGKHLDISDSPIPTGFCLTHDRQTCACGWEMSHHYGVHEKIYKKILYREEQEC